MRLLVVAIIIGCAALVVAQNKEQDVPKFEDPYGAAPLIESLDDIRFFDSVSKLSLTKEQIEKIITALDDVKKTIKEVQTAEAKELLALKSSIKKQRGDSLNGKAASDEFWTKVEKVDTDSRSRRAKDRITIVKNLSNKIKPIFTEEQMKKIKEISRKKLEDMKDPGLKDAKDDQLLWFYVESVFVVPPRTQRLLQEMAKAKG